MALSGTWILDNLRVTTHDFFFFAKRDVGENRQSTGQVEGASTPPSPLSETDVVAGCALSL